MKATSIHLKACDLGSAGVHNKREKKLDYAREDLEPLNEYFSYIGDKTLPTIEAEIRREVKAKTGRKLQKNAIPIKEGVIVIDENTTLKDLQNFCEECRTKFGMQPLWIDIHRDEGHPRAKEWKPNLHAHIVWRMYDENGRNVRLSKQDMADMQTMAAHHLHMERGKRSDKKHLSSLQFKIKAEEEALNAIESDLRLAEGERYAFERKCTTNVENFYEEAGELGLSCHEATQLRKGYEEALKQPGSRRGVMLSKPYVTTPDGISIIRDDPENPNIDIFYGRYSQKTGEPMKLGLWVRFSLGWKPVRGWLRAVMDSPWFRIFRNGQEISDSRQNGIKNKY